MNDTIPMPPYSSSNSDWTSSSTAGKTQPNKALHVTQSNDNELLQLAAQELETMKQQKPSIQASRHFANNEQSFPTACLRLMSSLPGNSTCVDCHSRTDITWASVSFGCLMCLQCSGKHRSLGVQTSFVKSVSMDGWKVHEILSMLEGGNDQLDKFFERHNMGKSGANCSDDNTPTSPTSTGTLLDRYKTKAASFYRQHLINHAKELGGGGIYKGREASRSKKKKTPSPSASRKHQRQQQQHPSKTLPTVKERCASMASLEASASNDCNGGNDVLVPPPISPTQPREMKRQRSKGSGSDIGFTSDNFQKMG